MENKIFIPVKVLERLPEIGQTVIAIDKHGRSQQISIEGGTVYYHHDRIFPRLDTFKKRYTYWLEERTLPTEDEIEEAATTSSTIEGCFEESAFIDGAEFVINKLITSIEKGET